MNLIPFNPDNPEHVAFLFKMIKEDAGTLLDDSQTDPIRFHAMLAQRVNLKAPMHFLAEDSGAFLGYLDVAINNDGNGILSAIMTAEKRHFFVAKKALLMFVRHCFNELRIPKIKASIPVFNKNAEAIARAAGFRKEGIAKNERAFHGKRRDMLQLALFPWYLKDNKNV